MVINHKYGGRPVDSREDCDLCGKEPPEIKLQRMWIGDRYEPYLFCAGCRMRVYFAREDSLFH